MTLRSLVSSDQESQEQAFGNGVAAPAPLEFHTTPAFVTGWQKDGRL